MVRVHVPQGNAFSDVKFWLGADVVPTVLVVSGAVPDPTGEVGIGGMASIDRTGTNRRRHRRRESREQIENNPGLAAAIGGGALLLIILVVVLLVTLLRGRRAKQAAMAASSLKSRTCQSPGVPLRSGCTALAPSFAGASRRPRGGRGRSDQAQERPFGRH